LEEERLPVTEERRQMLTPWSVIYSCVGHTLVVNSCPFCGERVKAFLWSLAGCGKRCACGAVLGTFTAWKKQGKKVTCKEVKRDMPPSGSEREGY